MNDEFIEALLERIKSDEPLSDLALNVETAAKAAGNAEVATKAAAERKGYPKQTSVETLTQVGRKNDDDGRMKLSAIEFRFSRAKQSAARPVTGDNPSATFERAKDQAEAQRYKDLLAERRLFLLGLALSLRKRLETPERWACSIHGILTRGVWQKDLVPLLSVKGFHPHLFDYKWYDPLRMLFRGSREKKIDAFRNEYDTFMQIHDGVIPSIIAHSFGTYIVANAMDKYGLEFDRIIFCGSIVQETYSWTTQVSAGRVQRVLHDFGRQDIWARLAAWVIEDAGQSGFNGFEDEAHGAVVQRRHERFRHSDYFYATNFTKRWIPFLDGIDPAPIEPDAPLPLNWRFRIVKYTFISALLAAAFAVLKLLHVV